MKTVQIYDGIIIFKEMNNYDATKFIQKWKEAIDKSLSVLWSDIIVVGDLQVNDEQTKRTTS